MSGIAGLIRFDGQPVADKDVYSITQILRHRGDVHTHTFNQGVLISFGKPVEVSSQISVFASADADLYGQPTTDSFFTTTYTQQGPASFNDLNADFAVAIWDERQQTLCCVRDILGVKPLYYVHHPGRLFAFASEIKALLALSDVMVKPNPSKFRQYLTWPTAYVPYDAETFYESIYNILPGHYLQVNAQTLTQQPYWIVDLEKFNSLDSPEAYADLFRESFTTAVANRIEGKKNVGAHLSGGLDSSSVSCVAQTLLSRQHRPSLHTFNINSGLASTDESEYVQAVVDRYHTQHHTIQQSSAILEAVLKINQLFDRPEHFIIGSDAHLKISRFTQQIDCDAVLTGHDGDSVATFSFSYLDKLFEAEDWQQLLIASRQFVLHPARNLVSVSPNWQQLSDDDKLQKYLAHTLASTLKDQFKKRSFANFLTTLRGQQQFFGIPTTALITYGYQRLVAKLTHQTFVDNALRMDFKQHIAQRSIPLSAQGFKTTRPTDRPLPFTRIVNTWNVLTNEQLNHIGAYYGHQYSFPFFDKQVVELGLATPLSVGFDQGRGRGLIRQGLRGILPSTIVSRITKANFAEYGNLSAQQLYQATQEQFSSSNHPIWEVIDRKLFAGLVNFVYNPRVPALQKTRYNWLMSRSIYLALWLNSVPKKL